MLVVDRHALEAINFLHFVDEVLLQFLRSADFEDFVRIHRAFGQLLAFLDEVALEDDDVLADRDEMFLFRAGLRVLDENAALAAHARAEVHDAVNLGDFRGVLRTARFEQFRHARQTAGDVLGLGRSCAASWPSACRRRILSPSFTTMCAPDGNRIIRDDFALVVA